jgi:hypothetical protein
MKEYGIEAPRRKSSIMCKYHGLVLRGGESSIRREEPFDIRSLTRGKSSMFWK